VRGRGGGGGGSGERGSPQLPVLRPPLPSPSHPLTRTPAHSPNRPTRPSPRHSQSVLFVLYSSRGSVRLRVSLLPGSEAGGWPSGGGRERRGGGRSWQPREHVADRVLTGYRPPSAPRVLRAKRRWCRVPSCVLLYLARLPDCQIASLDARLPGWTSPHPVSRLALAAQSVLVLAC